MNQLSGEPDNFHKLLQLGFQSLYVCICIELFSVFIALINKETFQWITTVYGMIQIDLSTSWVKLLNYSCVIRFDITVTAFLSNPEKTENYQFRFLFKTSFFINLSSCCNDFSIATFYSAFAFRCNISFLFQRYQICFFMRKLQFYCELIAFVFMNSRMYSTIIILN